MIDNDDQGNVQTFDLQGATRRAMRTLASGVKDEGGDAEGVVNHPDLLDTHNHASTVLLCKDVADMLVRNFPGWAWAVQPDERGGIINIFNQHCHSELGYTIHMDRLDNPRQRRREVMKAGGEILERFRMPVVMDAAVLADAPRDARGMLIPDLRGLNMVKQKRDAEIAMKLATGEWEIVETPEGRYVRTTR